LGCVVNGRAHRKEVAKLKGLEEIGNEKINHEKIDNERTQKLEKRWDD